MNSFQKYKIIKVATSRYYRGTNSKNEELLIKNNTIRNSINHITNKSEIGLSVVDNGIGLKNIKKYFKYVYELSGKVIGNGSDGELLLDTKTIKFIGWIQ